MNALTISALAGISGGCLTYAAIRAARFAYKARHMFVPAELRAKHARG